LWFYCRDLLGDRSWTFVTGRWRDLRLGDLFWVIKRLKKAKGVNGVFEIQLSIENDAARTAIGSQQGPCVL